MTPIAEMVERMMAAGLAAEMIVLAVRTCEMSAGIHRNPADETMEKRRAWDRERKRATRSLRLPESEWLPLVAAVLKRDGYRCRYCGNTEKLTADHVVPMSRGGTHDLENLSACCIPCNTKKSNKLLAEWLPSAESTDSDVSVSSPAPPSPFPPITPLSSSPPPTPSDLEGRASARKAGSRLPLDWEPTLDDREYGRHLGLTEEMIWATAEEMKLWGEANSNRAIARKANWSATFKGFLRRAVKTPQGKSHDRRNGIQEALGSIERRASQGGSNVVGLLPVGRRE